MFKDVYQKIIVPFHNTDLVALQDDKNIYVAMKPVVKALKLDWGSQRKRIERDDVLSSVMVMMTTSGKDGKNYQMLCLPLQYLNGWLFGIDTNRISKDLRDLIIIYKKECYNALYSYFKGNQRSFKDDLLLSILKAEDEVSTALALNEYESKYVKPLEESKEKSVPKVTYHDIVLKCPDSLTIKQIAKDFGLTGKKLNKILSDIKVQYKDKSGLWLLYSDHLGKHYTQTEIYTYKDQEGKGRSTIHTEWTQKGRLFIYESLKPLGILPLCEVEPIEVFEEYWYA